VSTFADKVKEFVGRFGFALNQTVPMNDKSFLYNLSVALASIFTAVDKKAVLSKRETLATTATREGLTEIGRQELGRDPNDSTAFEGVLRCAIFGGVTVPLGTLWTSEDNNAKYESTETVVGTNLSVDIPIKSVETGGQVNLSDGDQLSIETTIPNLSSTGFIFSVTSPALSVEGTEEYRAKVLDKMRSQGGGSNGWDYRIWAQEVLGVKLAYPYGGDFDDDGKQSGRPLTRTIYIQATEDIDEDGIAPDTLLDNVYDYLITEPETGRNRISLGVPNERDNFLFVKSIRRYLFKVNIYESESSWPTDATDAITEAVQEYFFNLVPFVAGLDPIEGRTNAITNLSISDVVYTVATQYGVTPSKVEFFLSGKTTPLDIFPLPAGGLAKLDGAPDYL
jgi:hypothetical protein